MIPIGALTGKKAASRPRALLFKYLADRLNGAKPGADPSKLFLPARVVRGKLRGGGEHAWNLVLINGEHYVVDLMGPNREVELIPLKQARDYVREGFFGREAGAGGKSIAMREPALIDFKELKRVRKLTEGGFGRCWLYNWNGLEVVVKEVIKMGSEAAQKQLEHELKNLSALDHPNIIRLYGFCCASPDSLSLVMEYVPDGSLQDALDEKEHQKYPHALVVKSKKQHYSQVPSARAHVHTDTGCEGAGILPLVRDCAQGP